MVGSHQAPRKNGSAAQATLDDDQDGPEPAAPNGTLTDQFRERLAFLIEHDREALRVAGIGIAAAREAVDGCARPEVLARLSRLKFLQTG
jgi:hypothetical protein